MTFPAQHGVGEGRDEVGVLWLCHVSRVWSGCLLLGLPMKPAGFWVWARLIVTSHLRSLARTQGVVGE